MAEKFVSENPSTANALEFHESARERERTRPLIAVTQLRSYIRNRGRREQGGLGKQLEDCKTLGGSVCRIHN